MVGDMNAREHVMGIESVAGMNDIVENGFLFSERFVSLREWKE